MTTTARSASSAPPATRTRATFATAYIAVFIAQFTNALPAALNGTFQAEFHTEGSQLVWISAAFMIPLVVFELTFGVLGDLFGRRRLLRVGTAFIVLGGAVALFAPTVTVMWVAQALNGLGAGILFPTSLAMIAAVTPGPDARARGIAAWAGFLSLGSAIAPLVGGVFAQLGSWRLSYIVVAVVAVVATVTSLRALDSSAPEGRKLDIPGQITLAVGLIAVLYATVEGSETGWGRPNIVAAYVVGVALLIAFVVIELRTRTPLVHLGLFKNRSFAIAGLTAVIGTFAFLTIAFSISLWVGVLQQTPPVLVGILFVVVQGPAFVLIPVVAVLLRRVAPRWLLTAGFVLVAISAFWLATFDITHRDWTQFIPPLLVLGVGFAFTVSTITAVAINTVPLHYAGMASAMTNLLRDLGFALGPVVGGAVAYGIARGIFSPAFLGIAGGAGIPAPAAAQLAGTPPIAFLASPQLQAALPPNTLQQVLGLALTSLGSGFSTAYVVAGIAAVVAALLTLFGLGRHTAASSEAEIESL